MKKLIGEHPNVARLVGFRQVGLCWEQFMEYVSGGSLFDYINENYVKSKNRFFLWLQSIIQKNFLHFNLVLLT